MPLLDLFFAMLWFFLFFAWIMLLFNVFGDIFRSDMSGGGKALWVTFVLLVPLLGVLVYLMVHGDDMQKRALDQAMAQAQAQRAYIQEAAGSGGSSADELKKLAGLHQQGVLTDAEFQTQKAKVLA